MRILLVIVMYATTTQAAPSDLGWLRYPFANGTSGKYLIDKDPDDGYPTYIGANNAETCPTHEATYGDLRIHCNDSARGHRKLGGCHCGRQLSSHTHNSYKGCYKCGVRKVGHQPPFRNKRPDNLQCPNMTRRQILERGIGWVVNGHDYQFAEGPESCAQNDPNPHCPQYNFQLVCNGFVDMAWYGCGPNCQERIDCMDMEPGDHVHVGGHNYLFRKWNGPKKEGQNVTIWQMGGGWGKANSVSHSFHNNSGHCFRRKNLVPDTQEFATILR